jgi:cardiolipin synthase
MMPASASSPVRLLDGARETWARMLAAIAGARERVHFEVYAFLHDHVGRRFIDELGAAARRGVDVVVTIDAWGSAGSREHVISALRAAGCRARAFNRFHLRGLFRIGRNHRKLLVVDDRIAFVGGINVGDRFSDWSDVAVEVRGLPAAALGRRLRGEREVPQLGPTRIHLSRLGGGRRLFRRYVKAFASAHTRLWVAHSYFLPGPRLIRQLRAAARRGVDVRLLLPGRSDVPLARLAMGALYAPLLAAGVRIYEHRAAVLHAKMAVIDGRTLLVGSFNLDPYSLANLEVLVVADDATAAVAGDRWIGACLAAASRVRAAGGVAGWLGHAIGILVLGLARLLARLMRRAQIEARR